MNRLWTTSLLAIASIGACRGNYIGIEDCNDMMSGGASSTTGGASSQSGGKSGSTNGGKSGTGGRIDGQGGAPANGGQSGGTDTGGSVNGGEGGAPLPPPGCEADVLVPPPSLYVSFDDCSGETVLGKLNRPYYTSYGAASDTIHGTLMGNVGCVDGASGLAGDLAVEFPSASGNIAFDPSPAYDLETEGTISVWIKQAEAQTAWAFGKWYGADQFGFEVDEDVWRFSAAFYPNGTPVETSVASDTPVEFGKWVHFVIVAKRGYQLALYQDGRKAGALALPSNFVFQFSLKELVVGRLFQNPDQPYFKGSVDELKIWRTALFDAEVQSLFCP